MEYLLGKPVSEEIRKKVKEKVLLKKRKPKICILLNNEDSSSLIYVKAIIKACLEVNIDSEVININSEDDYIKYINLINEDSLIDACLITRPLLRNVNEEKIISLLKPSKDVDALNPHALGKILVGNEELIPSTALAMVRMLDYYHIDVKGKKVLVIGRSISVGKPISLLLLNRHATVTIAHSRSVDLNNQLKEYDLIVGALGKAQFIDSNLMKEGAIVLDAGIHYIDNKIVGDVLPSEKLSYISKVPGGIGVITTSCLMENILTCYEVNNNDK